MNALAGSLAVAAVQVTAFAALVAAAYIAIRRRGAATASWFLGAGLVGVVGVFVMAISPWPLAWQWTLPLAPQRNEPLAEARSLVADANESGQQVNAQARPQLGPSEVGPSYSAEAWAAFQQNLARQDWNRAIGAAPGWLALVLGLVALSVAWGAGRLALGLWAVSRCRAESRPVLDQEFAELLELLRAEMCCPREVELRASSNIGSPAVVGWRRPVIMLPDDWPTWTSAERRSVLAHEVAHITRGDWMGWLIAQACVAVHFYHPLVHWLAARLRLEQELAADALAAMYAGGRESYLAALAQMALRQDDRATVWAARPFTPGKGTFLRRITMLRFSSGRRDRSCSLTARAAIGVLLVAAAMLVSGVRGPRAGLRAGEGQPSGPPAAQTGGGGIANPADQLDASYIPEDALVAIGLRPADVLSDPSTGELVALINTELGFAERLGLPVEHLAEVKLVVIDPRPGPNIPFDRIILRAAQPHDWKGLIGKLGTTTEKRFLGKSYVQGTEGGELCAYLADDRTLVLAKDAEIQRILVEARSGESRPDWAESWADVAGGQVVVAANPGKVRALLAKMPPPPEAMAFLSTFSPLWEQTNGGALGLTLADGMTLAGHVRCQSPEAAETVHKTLEALLALGGNSLPQAELHAQQLPPGPRAASLALLKQAKQLLESEKLSRDDKTVQLTATSGIDAKLILNLLLPAVHASRKAAAQSQSSNNLRQLGLAMYNYLEIHKRFPPAVVMGPDGKTPHSWRIELLPYLDGTALYNEYKMDEPWDSENNKRVLTKMPTIFRHPSDSPDSTNTSYLAITGEKTLFSGTQGTQLSDVLDGTALTILLVEVKSDIPWTKPVDLAYTPGTVPEVGGWSEGGYHVGLADGSVRFFRHGIEKSVLERLITVADGKTVLAEEFQF